MEKSLALALPDRSGSLREVIRVLSSHDVSLLRMSYNRVVDVHALFLDVFGTVAAIQAAEEELRAWRFFPGQREVGDVWLVDLALGDDLAALEPVLAIVEQQELNITFVDVRTDSSDGCIVRLSLYVTDPQQLAAFLNGVAKLCDYRVVPKSEQSIMLDNNHFNLTFAHGLAKLLDLGEQEEEEILINSNRIMQNLMSEGSNPFKPFDYIRQVGETIASYRGPAYIEATRISHFTTAGGLVGHCIEPPVGSDTWVLECDDCVLCIDAGYTRFADDLQTMLRDLCVDWDQRPKKLLLTHADIDHAGGCHLFDEVYATGRVIDNFAFETMGIVNWREQSPLSHPYTRIGSVLSGYKIPPLDRMTCLGEESPLGEQSELLRRVDTLEVAPLCFEVWEGKGGHVRGETMFIERTHKLCISGDVFVNVHGETKPQARYNVLCPYLMTSVDSNPELAREERTALFGLLDAGTWQILGGHGALYEWTSQR